MTKRLMYSRSFCQSPVLGDFLLTEIPAILYVPSQADTLDIRRLSFNQLYCLIFHG